MKRLLFIIPYILFLFSGVGISAQQKFTVTGKIVDVKNLPLVGVAVVEKGTKNGVASNLDGKFTLVVSSPSSTITITYLGFVSKEVPANEASVIVLEEDAQLLSEVLVIGYGQVRKADATGAIAAIKPDEITRGAVVAPQELLIGKVAGVQITPGDGSPGAGATIRIRSGASLRASNDPLIVIDGIPVSNDAAPGMRNPLASVNPSDIETFTVLKDASATAIYGSRASNGVIIITTKKGGKKLKVDYNSTYTASQNVKYINSLNAAEFKEKIQQIFPVGTSTGDAAKALMGTADTDWQKLIYQTGLTSDQNLAVSGQLLGMPVRLSAGLNNQIGTLKTSTYNRVTTALNLAPSFFDNHLKVVANVKYVGNQNNYADGGAVGNAIFYDPTQPVYNLNSNGSINYTLFNGYKNWGTIEFPNTLSRVNPLSLLNDHYDGVYTNRVLGNIDAEYSFHFLSDLKAHLNIGFDAAKGHGKNGVEINSFQSMKDSEFKGFGSHTNWSNVRRNNVLDFYLNYKKDLPSLKSTIDVMGGYSWQHFYSDDFSQVSSNNYLNPVDKTPTTFATENYLVSFYGRLNYSLLDKYLLTFTIRDDGSSRFSPATRWGLFPSAAFAWQVNKESFLKNIKSISDLKLRLSYGITGQQDLQLNDYPYIALYNQSTDYSNYQFGSTFYKLLKPTGYDENIKWEETTTYNIGVDLGMFKNRITGSIDVYLKETNDLLNEVGVAAGTNFSNRIVTNVGNLKNKGVEFNVKGLVIDSKDLQWDLGFNATWSNSEITKLTAVNNPDYLGIDVGGVSYGTGGTIQKHAVGYSPYTFYTYQQVYNTNGMPIQNLVVDRNNDGKITEADRYLTEYSPLPKFYLGLNTTVTFKKFDIGFNLRANLGNYIFNDFASGSSTARNFSNQGSLDNMSDVVIRTGFTQLNEQVQMKSDYFIENASFLKMDNITLGYNLDNLFAKNINGRVSFSVQNVFVITKYTGLDPEVYSGIDNNMWPRPRMYTLGLKFNF